MKLRQLYPGGLLSSPDGGMQELMRGFLVRTNFVPGVRHVIGWRGLKESSTGVDGWTAKIKAAAGIFGLYFCDSRKSKEWINGRFALCYFPDPQEALIETCSLAAGAYTQQEDYLPHIRDFLRYPQLCELFHIGVVTLDLNMENNALLLGLESVSDQRLVAQDGVSLDRNGRSVELVAPGGVDQNFPAYATALAFFRVLAASFTFNLQEPPSFLRQWRHPGKEFVYDATGHHWERPSVDSQEERLCLGYGNDGFTTLLQKRISTAETCGRDVCWQKGPPIPTAFKEEPWWKSHHISDYKTLDKNMLGIDERPQLIVLTGFLGSGKTSFLQHFIEYQVQRNRFVAVIQNEIGEIGLDGKLLDHDYAVTEIDEGCVCCSLIGNLKTAIHQILLRFHPDAIVLETTGLANPFNLLDELSEVEEWVRFDSITTVVDGLNALKSIEMYAVASDQIKAADILLINKEDLLTKRQLQKIRRQLKTINPAAPILTARHGDINPALVYGVDPQDEPEVTGRSKRQKNDHQVHCSHAHDGLSSHKISFSEPLDKTLFIEGLKSIPRGIFRIKGVVDFTDVDKPQLVQYVGGRFEISEFENPKMTERFLVLIGQEIESHGERIDWPKRFAAP